MVPTLSLGLGVFLTPIRLGPPLSLALHCLPATHGPQTLRILAVVLVPLPRLIGPLTPLGKAKSPSQPTPPGQTIRLAGTLYMTYGGKPWQYVLLPHDVIADNMTLKGLAKQYGELT